MGIYKNGDFMTPKEKRAKRAADNEALAVASGQAPGTKEDGLQGSLRAGIEERVAKRLKRKLRLKELEALDKAAGRKKFKLLSVRRAKQVLWEIVSEIVKTRDRRYRLVCVTCLERPVEVACHIIPKSESLNTAFDLDNIYGGCSHCNRMELRYRGKWARIIFPQIFGQKKIAMLNERSKIKVDWDRVDFAEKIAQARILLDNMKGVGKKIAPSRLEASSAVPAPSPAAESDGRVKPSIGEP